ncbi:MAG TPA: hypothetical protein VHJ54_10415 [Solirubrobacterales bacterium]|jgi:hypothetical protein|nr:hypothetical protein [Solirubrobacterales bacterium]
MPGPSGKVARAGLGAIVVALVALVALGAVAGAKKKGKKLPRGPYPSLGACAVFPKPNLPANAASAADLSAWNQDISAAPVDPNSGSYISYINANGGDFLHPDFGTPREYGFPYAVTGRKQKRTKVRFTAYGEESTHGRYRIPLKALVEGGRSSDGDRHVLSIDRKRCKLQELYRAFARKTPKPHWDADAGVIWDLRSAALRPEGWTSADAAGMPIFPGLVRYDEVRAGAISHAIRVTVNSTRDAWVHPATHCAGDSSSANAPPMGLRMRLNGGYDIANLTGAARVIAVALKRYGFFVTDNGSNWFFSGTSDRRWDDENLDQLKSIPGAAFEVVRSAAPIHAC